MFNLLGNVNGVSIGHIIDCVCLTSDGILKLSRASVVRPLFKKFQFIKLLCFDFYLFF